MAELRLFRSEEEIARVQLDGRLKTLGRGSLNDILVPDLAVSRQQCSVEKVGDKWLLRDMSGNCTEVDGRPVELIELHEGAEIKLAHVRLVFSMAAKNERTDPVTQRNHSGRTLSDVNAPQVPKNGETVRLCVASEEGERVYTLGEQAVIGTAAECTVQLASPFVSSRHLTIEHRERGYLFKDLGSKNGTWLGDTQIVEALVPTGRAVRVGPYELTLRRVDEQEPSYEGIVGRDPVMREVYETIERVAPTPAIVVILGESGTGKELVARAIHARSNRADKPFVPVNCGALNRELVESELFGHEKGAFTGADRDSKGAFGEAEGGTLFFDEIGELPLESQAKLLRALETGEVKRVGSALPLRANVRVVAATNRDLRNEVRRGRFREDLYWRIRVININLPALRQRRADLGLLIQHFLDELSPADTRVELASEAERVLLEHDWPGNVRELKNTLIRSLWQRRKGSSRIEAEDIRFDHDSLADAEAPNGDPDANDNERVFILGKSWEAIEDEVLVKTYRRLKTTSPTRLGKALSISRSTVYRKYGKLGLEVKLED